jgi:Xaa-Pro aminopeptidase
MIDQDVRRYFESFNLLQYTKHRTGHSIDTEVHGIGVNLDCFEFADTRPVIAGSCFSIEPGLYTDDFGMRSEINVYIENDTPIISGGPTQKKLVLIGTE